MSNFATNELPTTKKITIFANETKTTNLFDMKHFKTLLLLLVALVISIDVVAQRRIDVGAELWIEPSQTEAEVEHIHEGTSCTGNKEDEFADAMSHYNPKKCSHPYHAGDLPPLMSYGGRAYLAVITDRFSLADIIGRTVVIHGMPDDFRSQPAGNSGAKIACGSIQRIR